MTKCGPNIGRYVNNAPTKRGLDPLFDPGEVSVSQRAMNMLDILDVHPGQVLADHICGMWDEDNDADIEMNKANLAKGLVHIHTHHLWEQRSGVKGKPNLQFWFYCVTEDGHTTLYAESELHTMKTK